MFKLVTHFVLLFNALCLTPGIRSNVDIN